MRGGERYVREDLEPSILYTMKRLNEGIVNFFRNQSFVIVSTIDSNGNPHNSCKGVLKINKTGKIYLLDLYLGRTYANLIRNPHIGITAVDGHLFKGYCLKGKAKIIPQDKISPKMLRAWEERVTGRITQRVLKNVRGERGHPKHPEALFPKPQYMIVVEVEEIVDLTPHHLT